MKVPSGWSSTLLHRVADVRTGLSKNAKRDGPTIRKPYIRVANVQDGFLDLSEIKEIDVPENQVERFTLKPGDILLIEGNGNPANLGRGCVWDGQIQDCVHQNHIFAVRTLSQAAIRPGFLALQLQSDRGRSYLLSCAKGSTGLSTLNSGQLKEFPLLLPPIRDQDLIVDTVSTWNSAIEKMERLIVAKEKLLTGISQELFGARMRQSKPGWKAVHLSEVLTEHGRLSTGKEEVFSVSVHKGLVNQIEHLGRSFSAIDTGNYNVVLPGDIVYTKSPTGDFPYGIVKQSYTDANVIVSPLYGVFSPLTSVLGVLIDLYFESPTNAGNYLRPLIQKGAKNTIGITNSGFLSGKLFLPLDPKEQEKISKLVLEVRKEVSILEVMKLHYQEQKRGLMQKLLTGQWRVPVKSKEAT